VVVEQRVIDIDPTVPEGQYQLLVGIYDYGSGERFPVVRGGEGTTLHLGTVSIARRNPLANAPAPELIEIASIEKSTGNLVAARQKLVHRRQR
jgi:hypothetical protein